MERRLEGLQQQLQAVANNLWCQTFVHWDQSIVVTSDASWTDLSYHLDTRTIARLHSTGSRSECEHTKQRTVSSSADRLSSVGGRFTVRNMSVNSFSNIFIKWENICIIGPIIVNIAAGNWSNSWKRRSGSIKIEMKFVWVKRWNICKVKTICSVRSSVNWPTTSINSNRMRNRSTSIGWWSRPMTYRKILYEQRSVNYHSQSDLLDVLECYFQLLNTFDDLKVRWFESPPSLIRPAHFKRYFSYYVCFGAVGLYAAYRIYSNRAGIADYVSTTYDSLKFFVNEHLVVPLRTIYTSTFESRASQATFENSQLNYAHSKKILEEMLIEYGQKHAPTLADIQQMSVEEFLGTLQERASNEDMNIVMKNYQRELDQPIRSALVGDLIKGRSDRSSSVVQTDVSPSLFR